MSPRRLPQADGEGVVCRRQVLIRVRPEGNDC